MPNPLRTLRHACAVAWYRDQLTKPGSTLEHSGNKTGMQPLYLARIGDLGHGDLVKVDCAACHHVAQLTPEFLLRLRISPQAKLLDLK